MKRSKMQQMSMEVTVGAFMFMVLLALGFFTIILSSESVFTRKHYREIIFDDVMGLRDGDSVAVRGFKVGKVSKLWLMPDGVHLQVSTEEPIPVHEGYTVRILSSSVLGGKYLQITSGDKDRPLLPESAVLHGISPVDLIDEATETFASIKETLVDGGILSDLEVTMEEMKRLTTNLNAGEGTLGRLLTDDSAYQSFLGLVKNLEEVSTQIQQGDGTVAKLIADDEIYQNIKSTTANLQAFSERLMSERSTLGRLMAEDDELYQTLLEAVAAMKAIPDRLINEEGTIGRLATDDALYEEAHLLLQEIRAAVDDFRETAPITSFTSIFFGAL